MKSEFKQAMQSIRSNGEAYTLRHINDLWLRSLVVETLDQIKATDWLAMRSKWLANPLDDSKATLIRLSSTIGSHEPCRLP